MTNDNAIDFSVFRFYDLHGWTVHTVKTQVDGYPTLGIRILFDDEAQRERFIRENLQTDFGNPNEGEEA